MRAILVCVDYADLLAHTLPYNRHHFKEVMVVTSPTDKQTQTIAPRYDCGLYITDAFYQSGADFNKWLALELALDVYGRHGWMVIMDADVAWPKKIPRLKLQVSRLYTPLARYIPSAKLPPEVIPPEDTWIKYRLRPNQTEWAGYTQIFHASDRHLSAPPWHDVDWKHAGGADSFFQLQWPPSFKERPPFNVLHLGDHGRNWCGRVTQYLDGSVHPAAEERRQKMRYYFAKRREEVRKVRKFVHDVFYWERIHEGDRHDHPLGPNH